jgi:hypothetical protein
VPIGTASPSLPAKSPCTCLRLTCSATCSVTGMIRTAEAAGPEATRSTAVLVGPTEFTHPVIREEAQTKKRNVERTLRTRASVGEAKILNKTTNPTRWMRRLSVAAEQQQGWRIAE